MVTAYFEEMQRWLSNVEVCLHGSFGLGQIEEQEHAAVTQEIAHIRGVLAKVQVIEEKKEQEKLAQITIQKMHEESVTRNALPPLEKRLQGNVYAVGKHILASHINMGEPQKESK